MSTEPKREVKRLSLEDIDLALNEIAQDSDAGPDRFRALKMLRTSESASVILPPPLDASEQLDRLMRVMKPLGPVPCRVAYHRCFAYNGTKTKISDPVKIEDANDKLLSLEERELCNKAAGSVRMLYKVFPELRRPGCPKGYPLNSGPVTQKLWRYSMAVKTIVNRQQIALDQAAKEANGEPTDGPGLVTQA